MFKPSDYERKTFDVKAEEVTFENFEDIAVWCNGTVDSESTRILGGGVAKLPIIKLMVQEKGDEKSEAIARIGYFVVKFNRSFRVYKPNAFWAMFEKKGELNEVQTDFAEALEKIEEGRDNSSIDGQETAHAQL